MNASSSIPGSPVALTSRRVRAHGLLLGIALWSIYIWVLSSPTLRDRNGLLKGTDFLHFYTLGTLALEHRGTDLYNMPVQSALAQEKVPEAGRLTYVPLYGPQVSLLFAPLAAVSYPIALAIWLTFSGFLYLTCCYVIWKTCEQLQSERATVLILVLAYPAFLHLMAWGQTSALALACFTGAYLALRSQRLFVAGLAIGCLAFKPQLGLAVAVIFVAAREWKLIVGAAAAAVAQLSVGWIYFGTPVMRDYVDHLLHVRDVYPLFEPRPYQMHSLRAFWGMLLPWPHLAFALYVVTSAALLVVAFRCWTSSGPIGLRCSALLLATVLVSPHLTIYDLVILAPAFLLVGDFGVGHRAAVERYRLGLQLYTCYALPLLGPLSHWTHFQLSIPAMAVLLWTVTRLADSPQLCTDIVPDPTPTV